MRKGLKANIKPIKGEKRKRRRERKKYKNKSAKIKGSCENEEEWRCSVTCMPG